MNKQLQNMLDAAMPPAPTIAEFFLGLKAYMDLKKTANPESHVFEEEAEVLVDKAGTTRVRSDGLKAVEHFRKALERDGETWIGWQLTTFWLLSPNFPWNRLPWQTPFLSRRRF